MEIRGAAKLELVGVISPSRQNTRDQSEGLTCINEDLMTILEPKLLSIKGQAVLVGHGQSNGAYRMTLSQSRLADFIQSLLHRQTHVRGEYF